MQDGEDTDLILNYAVRDDVRRVGYGQFPGAVDVPGTAEIRASV